MRLRAATLPFTIVALAACGTHTSQATTVVMGDRDCELSNTQLAAGWVDLTVQNTTSQPATMTVTENGGNAVAAVNVAQMATGSISVHLDEEDTYHFTCGSVSGPDVKPGD